jgi:hypothetical protein
VATGAVPGAAAETSAAGATGAAARTGAAPGAVAETGAAPGAAWTGLALAMAQAPRPTPSPRSSRRPRLLGGKKIVLEYDRPIGHAAAPPPPPPVPAGVDSTVVARAREAYKRGNVHLFAGGAVEAVASYRESLRIYPGYVAGYRGLGLAYEEQGDRAAALGALRIYVGAVPNAHDAPLVRKRIDRLQRSSSR